MNADRIIAVALLVMLAALYPETVSFPEGAAVFPKLITVVMGVLAVVLLAVSLRKGSGAGESKKGETGPRPYVTLLFTALYVVGINVLGFFTSSCIFVAALMFYLEIRSATAYVVTLSGLMLFYYLLFVRLLHVPLPQGLIY